MLSIEIQVLARLVRRRWRLCTFAWSVLALGFVIQTTLPFLVRTLLDDALRVRKTGLVVGHVLAIRGTHGLHRLLVIGNRNGHERGYIRISQDLRTDLLPG